MLNWCRVSDTLKYKTATKFVILNGLRVGELKGELEECKLDTSGTKSFSKSHSGD